MIGRLTQIILSIDKKTVIVSEGNDIRMSQIYKYTNTNTHIQFNPIILNKSKKTVIVSEGNGA